MSFLGPPFGWSFEADMRKNGVWKKSQKTESKKRAQDRRFAAEAGASGGGGGFTSELCKFLHYRLARPATSERGAADLQAAASAADLL